MREVSADHKYLYDWRKGIRALNPWVSASEFKHRATGEKVKIMTFLCSPASPAQQRPTATDQHLRQVKESRSRPAKWRVCRFVWAGLGCPHDSALGQGPGGKGEGVGGWAHAKWRRRTNGEWPRYSPLQDSKLQVQLQRWRLLGESSPRRPPRRPTPMASGVGRIWEARPKKLVHCFCLPILLQLQMIV